MESPSFSIPYKTGWAYRSCIWCTAFPEYPYSNQVTSCPNSIPVRSCQGNGGELGSCSAPRPQIP
jgi:hypothetical protein